MQQWAARPKGLEMTIDTDTDAASEPALRSKIADCAYAAGTHDGANAAITTDAAKLMRKANGKPFDWSDKPALKERSLECRIAYLQARIDIVSRTKDANALACTHTEAARITTLEDYKDGSNSPDKRTKVQQNAHRAAITWFGRMCVVAGKPVKTRTPRTSQAPNISESAKAQAGQSGIDPIAAALSSVMQAGKQLTTTDVATFALRVADLTAGFVNRAGKLVTGDLGDVMHHFVADARKYAKPLVVKEGEAKTE